MAPRERRTDAAPKFELMSGAAAAALQETKTSGSSGAPYVPPTPTNRPAAPPAPETPSAVMSGVAAEVQAQALKDAAESGTPFCEECEQAEQDSGELPA